MERSDNIHLLRYGHFGTDMCALSMNVRASAIESAMGRPVPLDLLCLCHFGTDITGSDTDRSDNIHLLRHGHFGTDICALSMNVGASAIESATGRPDPLDLLCLCHFVTDITESDMERSDNLHLLRYGHFGADICALSMNVRASAIESATGRPDPLDFLCRCYFDLPNNTHEASVYVCEVLDNLGYSKAMVRHRRDIYKDFERKMSTHMPNFTVTITGSKGEGFSAPLEGDQDQMYTHHYTICTLKGDATLTLPHATTVFTMDGEQCHAGHYFLELRYKGTFEDKDINAALFEHTNGRIYISSEKYTRLVLGSSNAQTVSGPAVTECELYNSHDHVHAFPCNNQKQLLSEWINRPRIYNWPPPELIQEISKLPAYLVPVGCKSSETKHMEWRLCFTGEQKLTDSFNESQYKLYILLKLLNNQALKPVCDEVSSYIMKNIVLWYFESNSQNSRKHLLIDLISCLKKLQQSIKNNYLSYYMIPSRNLLTGRIDPKKQQQLIDKLDELLQEGPRVILRCPTLLTALQMSPTDLTEKGRCRDELEKLFLAVIGCAYSNPSITLKDANQLHQTEPHLISILERSTDMFLNRWRQFNIEDRKETLDKEFANALS